MGKSCIGRYGLLVTSVIFVGGVIISTSSPSWIATLVDQPAAGATLETQFGPWFSRNRTCVTISGECSEWGDPTGISMGDCDQFTLLELEDLATELAGNPDTTELEARQILCKQNNTWRILAEFCILIVVGTAILVALATFTQCITCGCCGGSLDQLCQVLCWIEVILSIICWSFVISVVTIIRGEDIGTVLSQEVENLSQLSNFTHVEGLVTHVTQGNFLWGFWLFLISGTIFGALSAIFAGWAAKGSLLTCFINAIVGAFKCIFCLNTRDSWKNTVLSEIATELDR